VKFANIKFFQFLIYRTLDRHGEQLLEVLYRDVNMPEMDLAVTFLLHIQINGPRMLRLTFSKLYKRE